jgi:16S rRNA processing protein RimM
MKQEQCFQLGVFTRKVGTDGRLSLQLDTDQPEAYTKTESVFVELHGKLVPFFVLSFRLQPSNTAHVKLEDVDNAEQSDSLTGCAVFLPLEKLPPLSGTKFYYHEVIGWKIEDLTSGLSAGIIKDVLENGPNDLFQLTNDGQEVLIPVAEDWIVKVDRELGVITMNLPEGLLDVNRK